jgi:hypothetical protein
MKHDTREEAENSKKRVSPKIAVFHILSSGQSMTTQDPAVSGQSMCASIETSVS